MTTTTTTTTPPPPRYTGTDFSSFCALLGRPQILTGLFRDILQRKFCSPDHIEEPDLKHLIWQEQVGTNILIETAYRWRPDMTQLRPAVIVKRNAYALVPNTGIGNRGQGNPVDDFGNSHHEVYWTGSHTLFCIGQSGAQAELLATEVQRELTEFSEPIRESLQLQRFQPTQLGEIAVLEEAQETFLVPVTVGYVYCEKWTLKQRAPRLRNISMSLILEC